MQGACSFFDKTFIEKEVPRQNRPDWSDLRYLRTANAVSGYAHNLLKPHQRVIFATCWSTTPSFGFFEFPDDITAEYEYEEIPYQVLVHPAIPRNIKLFHARITLRKGRLPWVVPESLLPDDEEDY